MEHDEGDSHNQGSVLEEPLDRCQLLLGEVEILQRLDGFLDLADAARPNQGRGDLGMAQHPRQGELGDVLASRIRDILEPAHLGLFLFGDLLSAEKRM